MNTIGSVVTEILSYRQKINLTTLYDKILKFKLKKNIPIWYYWLIVFYSYSNFLLPTYPFIYSCKCVRTVLFEYWMFGFWSIVPDRIWDPVSKTKTKQDYFSRNHWKSYKLNWKLIWNNFSHKIYENCVKTAKYGVKFLKCLRCYKLIQRKYLGATFFIW